MKIAKVSKSLDFLEKEKLLAYEGSVVYVYNGGKYYVYDGDGYQDQSSESLTKFIGRIQNPLILVKEEGSIKKMESANSQHKYKTTVIGLFYDKLDYKEEIQQYAQAARDLAQRPEVAFYKATNQKLIKKLKANNPKWFKAGSKTLSLLIVIRYDGEIFTWDLSNDDSAVDVKTIAQPIFPDEYDQKVSLNNFAMWIS